MSPRPVTYRSRIRLGYCPICAQQTIVKQTITEGGIKYTEYTCSNCKSLRHRKRHREA